MTLPWFCLLLQLLPSCFFLLQEGQESLLQEALEQEDWEQEEREQEDWDQDQLLLVVALAADRC